MNIRRKFLLSPAVVLVLMLVLGIVGFAGLSMSNNSLGDVYNTRFQNFKRSSNALQNVGAAHADVYRLFTWMNNYDQAKIKQVTADINHRIDVAAEEVNVLAAGTQLSDEEKKSLAEIKNQLAQYRKQVGLAITWAQADPNMGITGMQSSDRAFVSLQKTTSDLVAAEDAKAREQYEASTRSYRLIITAFITLLVIAVIIGGVLSVYMSDKVITPLKEAIQSAQRIAKGDLTGKIHIEQTDETGDLLRALDNMQDGLKEIIGAMSKSSHELSQLSSSLTKTSEGFVHGANEQQDSTASMASGMEEMSVSINVVSDNARQADVAVIESAKSSHQGNEILHQTQETMEKISSAVHESATTIQVLEQESDRISEVAKVIKEIADQTNLLALNAAIEAARAGEQGRGFAVVADEVRKLADRTTNSTLEIANMIRAIQEHTQSSVDSMQGVVEIVGKGTSLTANASSIMADVEQRSDKVSSMVGEISAALKEQNVASQQIANHVEKIAQMAESIFVASRDTANSAERMSQLAAGMEERVSRFVI